jgi:hypothetical protein
MHNPQIGDRVVTNNLDWGVIESGPDEQGWFMVRLDSGRLEMQDGPRMSRFHPFGDPDPKSPEGQQVQIENAEKAVWGTGSA